MKIKKYTEFILETAPIESYSNDLLTQLKIKIQKMFEFQKDEVDDSDDMTIKKAKLSSNDKNKPTFKEFGLNLESLELSTKSNSLTLKFSDDECAYTFFISVKAAEVANDIVKNSGDVPEDADDFRTEDIKKCRISFKKYSNDNVSEILGQIPERNVDPKEIDEEFIINLKLDVDDKYGEKEEFVIET